MNIIADELKLKQDSEANMLVKLISDLGIEDANLYYNFPLYRGETKDDIVSAHVMFVSRKYGVIFFRCLSSDESLASIEKDKLDELDSYVYARINKREEFRKSRRELKINVVPYIFIPDSESDDPDVVTNPDIERIIRDNESVELTGDEFDLLTSLIEGSTNLKRKIDRDLPDDGLMTKGRVLSILQNKEACFDLEQKHAALNIIEAPQRIRGLAGSGKTVILAMKAALFHLQNPDAEILYTYYTKALYGQVRYLIEKFYRDFSDNREPDWNKIHILHGWGGKGLPGVYSAVCFDNGIDTISFLTAKIKRPKSPFEYIFEELDKYNLREKFDLTLIDEGQDFNKFFYRVCRKITKNGRIVWAYDDFQNIFDIEIQDEKETFGKDPDGNYYVDFSNSANMLQDIVLYRSYRNPRQVLTSAFALGLGIYNDRVLQRLENNRHWEDLGFKVIEGDSTPGCKMVIERPATSSPIDTTDLLGDIPPIDLHVFDDLRDETKFIADSIINDIRNQGLRPEDICVISLDAKNIRFYFSSIEEQLHKAGIKTFNLLNAPNNNTVFTVADNVTLSTINKAKGNEVGMVYIVGVDYVFMQKDFILRRNQLFTAITRSKGWVSMTGFSEGELCEQELKQLIDNNFLFIFTQPSEEQTKTIYRGMGRLQSQLNDLQRKLEELSNESGISIEMLMKSIQNQKDKK